jgi:hypothetical protein
MLAPITKALTSRAAGPAATAVAAVLAVLLAVNWASAAQTQDKLEGRIAQLNSQLNASRAAFVPDGRAPAGLESARVDGGTLPGAAGDKAAHKLLTEPPAGFDDCARMQSADDAVLSSLK